MRRTARRSNDEYRRDIELARQEQSLRAVLVSIGGETQLRPLLTRIVRHACSLIQADRGTIALIDERRSVIRTEAAYNMPRGEIGSEAAPGIGLNGEVLRRAAPVMGRYGDLASPMHSGLEGDIVMGVPIRWQGQMIGCFGVGIAGRAAEPPPRRFSRRAVHSLGVFADHAAIAIVNARRYQAARRRTERLSLVARVGGLVSQALQIDDLLQRAADAIHDILGYDNVAIALASPESPELLTISVVGGNYRDLIRGEFRIPITTGLIGAAARERRTVLVNDVSKDARHLPTPGAVGITAELAVPIILGERVLGVLNVEGAAPFGDEDAEVLGIIAGQLATAIENASLYEQARTLAAIEERHRIARELHDVVTQQLFSLTMMAESVGPAFSRDSAEGERRAARLGELSREALAEMKMLLRELRPHAGPRISTAIGETGLDRVRRVGLSDALRQLAADVTQGRPLVGFDPEGYVPQVQQHEEALYRIAQEALANAMRHSGAQWVHVRLTVRVRDVRLAIRDDGLGLEATRGRRRSGAFEGGLGLLGMRERAEALGGRVRVRSVAERGTSVEAILPRHDAASVNGGA